MLQFWPSFAWQAEENKWQTLLSLFTLIRVHCHDFYEVLWWPCLSVSPVCLSVCLRAYLGNYTSDLRQIFTHVTYVRSSVLLWRRCDMSCTSGSMDDVIFAHNEPIMSARRLSPARRWSVAEAASRKPVTYWCRLLQIGGDVCGRWLSRYQIWGSDAHPLTNQGQI